MTVVQLMRLQGVSKAWPHLADILGEVFDVTMQSGVSRLRSNTKLQQLLFCEDEREPKKRQKYETAMEEINNVCLFVL